MNFIVFRNKEDNSIARIENPIKYIERGHTFKEIEERIETYDSPLYNVSLQDIPESASEIIEFCAVDTTLLFNSNILHSCEEEVPNNTYIYAFYKHEGHNIPSVHIMKVLHKGVRLPEIVDKDNDLPIAWCRASEICNMLGFSRRNVNKLTERAERLSFWWYKKQNV